jgi:hypothetical protein
MSEIQHLVQRQRGYAADSIGYPGAVSIASNSSGIERSYSSRSTLQGPNNTSSWSVYGDLFAAGARDDALAHHRFPALRDISISGNIKSLPSDGHTEVLMNAYFRGCHTIRPLFDREVFESEARDLLAWCALAGSVYCLLADTVI